MAKLKLKDLIPVVLLWAGVVGLTIVAGLFFSMDSRGADILVNDRPIRVVWCESEGSVCYIRGVKYIVL